MKLPHNFCMMDSFQLSSFLHHNNLKKETDYIQWIELGNNLYGVYISKEDENESF